MSHHAAAVYFHETPLNPGVPIHLLGEIADNIDSPQSIFAIDIDNDGDMDVLSASTTIKLPGMKTTEVKALRSYNYCWC